MVKQGIYINNPALIIIIADRLLSPRALSDVCQRYTVIVFGFASVFAPQERNH